jgi:hypothetical protein
MGTSPEQGQLLVTDMQVSAFIAVDDFGARHQGHIGCVTLQRKRYSRLRQAAQGQRRQPQRPR